jgi:hypothetical protein
LWPTAAPEISVSKRRQRSQLLFAAQPAAFEAAAKVAGWFFKSCSLKMLMRY